MLDPFAPDPDALSEREREAARWHPERETLELAAAGAAGASCILGWGGGRTEPTVRPDSDPRSGV